MSIDISGERFGNLVALRDVGSTPKHGRLWLCVCDCGTHIKRGTGHLRHRKSLGKGQMCAACGEDRYGHHGKHDNLRKKYLSRWEAYGTLWTMYDDANMADDIREAIASEVGYLPTDTTHAPGVTMPTDDGPFGWAA